MVGMPGNSGCLHVPLGHCPGDADCIALLESRGADRIDGHLAGDAKHRNRIAKSVEQPGDRIGHAGAGSHQYHTQLADGSGIPLCGVDGCLLVPYQHVPKSGFAMQCIVKRQNGAAGIAEYGIDAVGDQDVQQSLGTLAA